MACQPIGAPCGPVPAFLLRPARPTYVAQNGPGFMIFKSSTAAVPDTPAVPRHIPIIMDDNGRWATKRLLPRVAGHVKGGVAVRGFVDACALRGIDYVTLFAFSSENWRRPEEEVSLLMRLFVTALEREVAKMHANNIRLKVVA